MLNPILQALRERTPLSVAMQDRDMAGNRDRTSGNTSANPDAGELWRFQRL